MISLSIALLGPPTITLDGTRILTPKTPKVQALFAYLAVESAYPHHRGELTGLFWPDQPEESARTNLRALIHRLQQALQVPASPQRSALFLDITRETAQFNRASDHWLDVAAFNALLAECRTHDHAQAATCAACSARLTQAVALYCGDFLAGLSLSASAAFDEWVLIQRETLRRQALGALETLAAYHEQRGDYAALCGAARRQLELEPWQESAHRQLMRRLALAGDRSAALAQYAECQRLLGQELGIEPDVETRALAERIRAGELSPVTLSAPAHVLSLPAHLTPLIGRERDLQFLAALLKQPGVRLVTLVGLGGMGKTRLALHLAGELAGSYADGVRLIELAALSDPALLPQAVAAALGLREASGQPLDQALASELRAKHLLLLLDNCEHLVDACRLLAEQLLRTCPGLTILATSREVLRITGERVWPVPALDTPGVEVATPELLLSYESIQLFVERASAANPAFALRAPNAPAAAQICRRLDGIPLAIELAAARLRHMTVEEIATRLDDRFELLTAGSAAAAPRQRTLRTAIDWSYSLLNPAEQALLRRLAVFAGGWTLQSAEAICAVESGDRPFATTQGRRPGTMELLSQLVDKSLLIVDQRHDTARYRLLETMRAYAHERLADAGELDMAREQHLAYFARLAEEAEPHLFAADQVAWLDRLAREHDNMRAAIDYAMERADAPTALRLVTALRSFWYTRGHYDEGRQRTLRALALPTAQAHTRARASALNAAGAILWAGGDAAQARQLLDEALTIGREIGDPLHTGWALLHMGMIAYQENDYPAAQPLLEAGLADCRAAGAAGRRGVGWALIFLGDLALHGDDTDLARSRFAESVALLRELADYGLLAYPLRRLGHLALQQGDFATATAHCAESLQLNVVINDRLAVTACLAALAAVGFAEGRSARAGAQTTPMLRAARLCGAVGAELGRIAAPLWPADAAMFTATIAAVREYLGEGVFATAAAEGSAIPFEQLIVERIEEARPGAAERPTVAAPPPGQRGAPVHNLPVAITPLVGRERELGALAAVLRRPDVRLVTLIGLGGMGKTRLALALAETCHHDYSNGVAFVALAHLGEAAAIPAAIAQALGLTLHAEDPLATLAGWLRERELLLVLDNFEHLLDGPWPKGHPSSGQGAELLATLLQAAPRLTALVTSRERLNLLGEHAYLVEGLSYTQAPAAVEHAAAVRLFVASAQRRRPDFAIDAANLSAILRICRQVQGMPLGLELAAAWVESLSPAEIAAEIAQSADFLTSEWRDLPERQRSIRTIFEMTWHRLSDEERQCFAQLALFRGGFTRQAARAVAGASTRILNRLVQKALLRVSASSNADGRYELHELLRQFAEETLAAAPGGAAGARRRHAAFFAALAEEAEPQLAGADQVAWLDRLEAEHDNVRAALGWAVAGGDRLIGLRLAAALGEFWWPRGHLSEGRRWLDLLLAGPAQPGAPETPGQELPNDSLPTVAQALACAGELAYGQGDHPRADALLQQSLACYRQFANRRGQARALRGLSNVLAAQGDQQAAALRAESLVLFRAIGDHLGIAWMLLETGRSEPDPARQLALLEESLALSRAGGYPRTTATALGNLGKLARSRGEHGLARRHMREALQIGRALRDGWLCAWMLDELGVLATHQGDWRQARFLLEESMALFRQDGNARGVALVAGHLAATPGDEEGRSPDVPLLATR